ncbi:hypothetical protein M2T82_12455 [Elizabethkingia ursingii]|uniref:hypothetical protein n=1 Tax=Elizabethkingia TaxID=308865 RepID=UPI000D41C0D4|nr:MULTISPECIES: hypothetical protein [Elizabethkingia]MCL1668876.1 hypothetical protein [Elizabethkingia ursingii]PUB34698.1 hypothetical protein C8J95_102366 [Elizabethkingia sp. YR214]
MLDNLKLITTNPDIIRRLSLENKFPRVRPPNNNYLSFGVYGNKLRLDFRKVMQYGNLIGFGSVAVNISPHYHFNNYQHNGNDLTPEDCMNSIITILNSIGITKSEYPDFKVVNIEFGVNIIPDMGIENIIEGILYHRKTPFRIKGFPYFKKSDATEFKQIKAYAKGIQFIDNPEYNIDKDMFRYEVRAKQTKNIHRYGIYTVNDLLNSDVYNTLCGELVNEWGSMLIVNINPVTDNINSKNMQFITKAKNGEFWQELIKEKHRNTFNLNKRKYYKTLGVENNLHTHLKCKIIDKVISLQNST